jgi:DNA-binding winged helix-turn-helix (wHTH) protein
MSASASQTTRIRFADFEADLRSQELFRDGAPVRLPNQSFLALAALLERPGQLVSREELRARLWPENRVVEFEQGLNAIINRLREALGDSADSPKFVETLPRRGYRFIGALDPAGGPAGAAAPARSPPLAEAVHDSHIVPLSRGIRLAAAAVIAVVSLGITLAALRWLPHDITVGTVGRRIVTTPAGTALSVTPVTTLLGQEHMPAISPDGTRVLFAWEPDGGFDLYIPGRPTADASRWRAWTMKVDCS